MADPSTIIGIGTLAVGAYGAYSSANAAEDAGQAQSQQLQAQGAANQKSNEANARVAEYKAKVARNNAAIAAQNRDFEANAGYTSASAQLAKTGAVIGKQRAGFGASGVDVNTGSAADVQTSTRMLGELDAETILSNAMRKAYGYDVQRAGFENEGALSDMAAADSHAAGTSAVNLAGVAAAAASDAGSEKAIASLISGAGSVSDKWLSYQNKGVFGGGSKLTDSSSTSLGADEGMFS